jgi:cell division protein FtsZ
MIPGLINLDFADVRSVMSGAGNALMGIGRAQGDNRAVDAAQLAMSSPLLEASIEGARGVLLLIAGGSDLGLLEANAAADMVGSSAHPDANIIFGAVIDDTLGDEVKVTVIAAGFDADARRIEQRGAIVRSVPGSGARAVGTTSVIGAMQDEEDEEDDIFRPAAVLLGDAEDQLDDDLDVPGFLR